MVNNLICDSKDESFLQEYCTVSLLSELNVQLSTLDNNIEKLYNKSQEIVSINNIFFLDEKF